MSRHIWIGLGIMAGLVTVSSLAMGAPARPKGGETAPLHHRSRVIDFDDTLVEGINKRPLDSLDQIGDQGRNRDRGHLYRKRAGFRDETQVTLHELRYRG